MVTMTIICTCVSSEDSMGGIIPTSRCRWNPASASEQHSLSTKETRQVITRFQRESYLIAVVPFRRESRTFFAFVNASLSSATDTSKTDSSSFNTCDYGKEVLDITNNITQRKDILLYKLVSVFLCGSHGGFTLFSCWTNCSFSLIWVSTWTVVVVFFLSLWSSSFLSSIFSFKVWFSIFNCSKSIKWRPSASSSFSFTWDFSK